MHGYFGIGVYHAKSECNIGTLMRTAYSYGASFVYTVGKRYQRQASDTVNAMMKIPLYHFLTVDELVDHLPVACPLIGVELVEGAQEVGNYTHMPVACYLLGAEDHGIPAKDLARCHQVIVIPGAKTCLNVAVAGSIVLFDRYRQTRQAA